MAANLADPSTLTADQMARLDNLHRDPGKHGRVNVEAWNAESGTVFGWSLERMGWSVGFNDETGRRSVEQSKYENAVADAATGKEGATPVAAGV